MVSYKDTYRHNRNAFEKSKETDGFKAWRRAQYKAQQGHCAWCYKEVAYKDMDVDHIKPLAYSGYNTGVNDFSNLVLSCHECNRDIKKDTTYNVVAYQNALKNLSDADKQKGYAPKKVTWQRPKWIGPNKYCDEYKNYIAEEVPFIERNVWESVAPLIMDGSLRQPELNYNIDKIKNSLNDNSGTIWKVVKWILIIGAVLFLIYIFINANNNKSSNTTTKYCDYECQERGRLKYEAEEEKKRREEENEYWEEAKRWHECKAAGGSDFDCG